jgi:hypothetical protein
MARVPTAADLGTVLPQNQGGGVRASISAAGATGAAIARAGQTLQSIAKDWQNIQDSDVETKYTLETLNAERDAEEYARQNAGEGGQNYTRLHNERLSENYGRIRSEVLPKASKDVQTRLDSRLSVSQLKNGIGALNVERKQQSEYIGQTLESDANILYALTQDDPERAGEFFESTQTKIQSLTARGLMTQQEGLRASKALRERFAVARAERELAINPSFFLAGETESLAAQADIDQSALRVEPGNPAAKYLDEDGNIKQQFIGAEGDVDDEAYEAWTQHQNAVSQAADAHGKLAVPMGDPLDNSEGVDEALSPDIPETASEFISKNPGIVGDEEEVAKAKSRTPAPAVKLPGKLDMRQAGMLTQMANQYGLPPHYAFSVIHAEMGGEKARPIRKMKDGSRVVLSSASGYFQILKGVMADYGYQGLAMNNPLKAQAQVFFQETQKNLKHLESRLGRDVTESELYIAHIFGRAGALRILSGYDKNPNASARSVMTRREEVANPHLARRTIGELIDYTTRRLKDPRTRKAVASVIKRKGGIDADPMMTQKDYNLSVLKPEEVMSKGKVHRASATALEQTVSEFERSTGERIQVQPVAARSNVLEGRVFELIVPKELRENTAALGNLVKTAMRAGFTGFGFNKDDNSRIQIDTGKPRLWGSAKDQPWMAGVFIPGWVDNREPMGDEAPTLKQFVDATKASYEALSRVSSRTGQSGLNYLQFAKLPVSVQSRFRKQAIGQMRVKYEGMYEDAQAEIAVKGMQTMFTAEDVPMMSRVFGEQRTIKMLQSMHDAMKVKQAQDELVRMSPPERQAYVQRLRPTEDDAPEGLARKAALYSAAAKANAQIDKQVRDDPYAFTIKHNPAATAAANVLATQTEADQLPAREAAINTLMDAQRKAGVPMPKPMPKQAATHLVSQIKSGKPDHVVRMAKGLQQTYGKHTPAVFAQLFDAGAPQEFMALAFVTDPRSDVYSPADVSLVYQAMTDRLTAPSPKDFRGDIKDADVSAAVVKQFTDFELSLPRSTATNMSQIRQQTNALRASAETITTYLAKQGVGVNEAAKRATETLMRRYQFAEVRGGTTVRIPADQNLRVIQRSLKAAVPETIDKYLDSVQFFSDPEQDRPSYVTEQARREFRRNFSYITSPDEQGVHVVDELGMPVFLETGGKRVPMSFTWEELSKETPQGTKLSSDPETRREELRKYGVYGRRTAGTLTPRGIMPSTDNTGISQSDIPTLPTLPETDPAEIKMPDPQAGEDLPMSP